MYKILKYFEKGQVIVPNKLPEKALLPTGLFSIQQMLVALP